MHIAIDYYLHSAEPARGSRSFLYLWSSKRTLSLPLQCVAAITVSESLVYVGEPFPCMYMLFLFCAQNPGHTVRVRHPPKRIAVCASPYRSGGQGNNLMHTAAKNNRSTPIPRYASGARPSPNSFSFLPHSFPLLARIAFGSAHTATYTWRLGF